MNHLYCGYVRDDVLRNLEEDIDPKFKVTAIPIINMDVPQYMGTSNWMGSTS